MMSQKKFNELWIPKLKDNGYKIFKRNGMFLARKEFIGFLGVRNIVEVDYTMIDYIVRYDCVKDWPATDKNLSKLILT